MKNYKFKFDGSPEAKECIKEINRIFYTAYYGTTGFYSNDNNYPSASTHYILLTPAEFLTRFKADHSMKVEWQPKVGEECQSENGLRLTVRAINGNLAWCEVGKPDDMITVYISDLRPIKPSVREQVKKELYDTVGCVSDYTIARIIQIVKGESDK